MELRWFLLFSLGVGPLLASTGGGESQGHKTCSVGKNMEVHPCALTHDQLNLVLEELVEEGLVIYINCLSFDRKGLLVSGLVSGVTEFTNASNPGVRMVLTCVGGVVLARPSHQAPLSQQMTSTACLNCVDQANDVCIDGK